MRMICDPTTPSTSSAYFFLHYPFYRMYYRQNFMNEVIQFQSVQKHSYTPTAQIYVQEEEAQPQYQSQASARRREKSNSKREKEKRRKYSTL